MNFYKPEILPPNMNASDSSQVCLELIGITPQSYNLGSQLPNPNLTKASERVTKIWQVARSDCRDRLLNAISHLESKKKWSDLGKSSMHLFFGNSGEAFRERLIANLNLLYALNNHLTVANFSWQPMWGAYAVAPSMNAFLGGSIRDSEKLTNNIGDVAITLLLDWIAACDSHRFGHVYSTPAYDYWAQHMVKYSNGAVESTTQLYLYKDCFFFDEGAKKCKYRSWGGLLAHELAHNCWWAEDVEGDVPLFAADQILASVPVEGTPQSEIDKLVGMVNKNLRDRRVVVTTGNFVRTWVSASVWSPLLIEFFLDYVWQKSGGKVSI